MKVSLLLSLSIACCWLSALSVNAQTNERFNYSVYNPITSGVFANFTYPARPLFEGADNRKSLTLKDGIFHPEFNERGYIKRMGAYLKYVEFADVTGDRHEEAIVALGNLCDCSGEWFGIYIYKLQRRRPGRLLWAFQTGDRAYGGLRRVYARQSKLVVELYGHGSGPNLPPPGYNGAYCCNEDYTRRSYKWNGSRFVQEGKARLLFNTRSNTH